MKLQETLLPEFQKILNRINSIDGETAAIKTDNYFLYSVVDPHKNGIVRCFRDYILRNKLSFNSKHQVLEMKIPFKFEKYLTKKNDFLTNLGCNNNFKSDVPRTRDKLFGLLRLRSLREVAYGDGISVAFYTAILGGNYLELIYGENPKLGLRKFYVGFKKLLN
jgi:hypothetical protein